MPESAVSSLNKYISLSYSSSWIESLRIWAVTWNITWTHMRYKTLARYYQRCHAHYFVLCIWEKTKVKNVLLKYRVHPFYTSKGGFFLVHRRGDGRCKKKKKIKLGLAIVVDAHQCWIILNWRISWTVYVTIFTVYEVARCKGQGLNAEYSTICVIHIGIWTVFSF